MALSNAERQARYKQRLKEAATPAWIRKDFDNDFEARETVTSFRDFFGRMPAAGTLELYSRHDAADGRVSLLIRLPWPMSERDSGMMKGWRQAKEDAEDLGYWHREI